MFAVDLVFSSMMNANSPIFNPACGLPMKSLPLSLNITYTKAPRRPSLGISCFFNAHLLQTHLDNGADVNARDETCTTPLMLACLYDLPEAVRFLLERGANVNDTNNSGSTAFVLAQLQFLKNKQKNIIGLWDLCAPLLARSHEEPMPEILDALFVFLRTRLLLQRYDCEIIAPQYELWDFSNLAHATVAEWKNAIKTNWIAAAEAPCVVRFR